MSMWHDSPTHPPSLNPEDRFKTKFSARHTQSSITSSGFLQDKVAADNNQAEVAVEFSRRNATAVFVLPIAPTSSILDPEVYQHHLKFSSNVENTMPSMSLCLEK